jgi:hypothetical protein
MGDNDVPATEVPLGAIEPANAKRVSWAAVFAGVVVILCVQLGLSLLGVGIGASTINPLTEKSPAAGLGVGSGIWLIVSTLIALYVGGLVAGRLAGMPRRLDGSLHGILAWGLATLATAYILTASVAGLIGGAANMIGHGAAAVGQGLSSAAPQVASVVRNELAEQGIDLTSIKNEAMQILRQTGKPALQPRNLAAQANTAARQAKGAAVSAAQAPGNAGDELSAMIDRVFSEGRTTLDAADKQALVNVLVARTDMTAAQASATVDRWQQAAQSAQAQLTRARDAAEQKSREVADAAAKGLARGAIWSFVAMVLGAGAAALGGAQGIPKEMLAIARERRSRVGVGVGAPAYQA